MRKTIIWACTFGATGVVLGALGAHALKAVLSDHQLASFEVGVRYQMYHAFFLLIIALLQNQVPKLNLTIVRNLTILGIFCFSFSIYFLALQDAMGIALPFLGPVTPVGGLFLISAWMLLLVKFWRFSPE